MTDTNSHTPQSLRDKAMARAHARRLARERNRAEWVTPEARLARYRAWWDRQPKRANPRKRAD